MQLEAQEIENAVNLKKEELKKIEVQENPKVEELKILPTHLKYAFLGDDEKNLVIISNTLSKLEEEKLFRILREYKTAIGQTISDLKG